MGAEAPDYRNDKKNTMLKTIPYPQIVPAQIGATNTAVPFDVDIDDRFKFLVGISVDTYDPASRSLLLASRLTTTLSVDGEEIFPIHYQVSNLYSDPSVPPMQRMKNVFRQLKTVGNKSRLTASIESVSPTPITFVPPFNLMLQLWLSDVCPPWAEDPYKLLCC